MLDILDYISEKYPNSKWEEVSIDSIKRIEHLTFEEFENKYGHLEEVKSKLIKYKKLINLAFEPITEENYQSYSDSYNQNEPFKSIIKPYVDNILKEFDK